MKNVDFGDAISEIQKSYVVFRFSLTEVQFFFLTRSANRIKEDTDKSEYLSGCPKLNVRLLTQFCSKANDLKLKTILFRGHKEDVKCIYQENMLILDFRPLRTTKDIVQISYRKF